MLAGTCKASVTILPPATEPIQGDRFTLTCSITFTTGSQEWWDPSHNKLAEKCLASNNYDTTVYDVSCSDSGQPRLYHLTFLKLDKNVHDGVWTCQGKASTKATYDLSVIGVYHRSALKLWAIKRKGSMSTSLGVLGMLPHVTHHACTLRVYS